MVEVSKTSQRDYDWGNRNALPDTNEKILGISVRYVQWTMKWVRGNQDNED